MLLFLMMTSVCVSVRISVISRDTAYQPARGVAASRTAATSAICRTQVYLEKHPRTAHLDV